MDLLITEIFYLFCCSLSMGAFGILTLPFPVNQVVLDGTTDVNITCRSSTDGNLIKWSFIPVGSPNEKTIKDGDRITDTDTFYGRVQPDDKCDKCFYDLFIKTASASTAGLYKCSEAGRRRETLFIVLSRVPSCDYTPKVTNQLPCNSTLQLSCTVSYAANTTTISPKLTWSAQPSTEDLLVPVENTTKSGNITTMTSTLNVTWPNDEGDMPIYGCNITFSLIDSKFIGKPPNYNHTFKPFASPNDVPCKWTKRTTLRQSTVTAVTYTTTTQKGVEKAKEGSSVRSAETNNLTTLVLGVAGVLILTQMF